MKDRQPMTADEIQLQIEDLARHGDGADKRWALGKLRQGEEARLAVPPPLTEEEVDERVGRILVTLPKDRIRRILNKYLATPGNKFHFVPDPPSKPQADIFPRSLQKLYQLYPEAKSIPNFTRYYHQSRCEGTESLHRWLAEKASWLETQRKIARGMDVQTEPPPAA